MKSNTRDELLLEKPVKDMTESEREAAIERLTEIRGEIVYQIEDIMQTVSKVTRRGHFKRRRHKLGKSPNDN